MFFRLKKKAFKAQKLQELKAGGDLDLIILDMMNFQIMDTENKKNPPFLVKQEYQALLELPYQQKFITVLQMLGYKHTKLLEEEKKMTKKLDNLWKEAQKSPNGNVK